MNTLQQKLVKTLVVLLVAIVSCAPSFAASAIKVNNNNNMGIKPIVYDRDVNPNIGITADDNAIGSTYYIYNEYGKVIKTGVIRSSKTMFIATESLSNGMYTYSINGYALQQFILK